MVQLKLFERRETRINHNNVDGNVTCEWVSGMRVEEGANVQPQLYL